MERGVFVYNLYRIAVLGFLLADGWSDRALTASFNLAGLTPGAYDVRVTDKANSATANDVFQVNNGAPGKLEVFVSAPGAVRPWNKQETTTAF